jgi:hypothetical protein
MVGKEETDSRKCWVQVCSSLARQPKIKCQHPNAAQFWASMNLDADHHVLAGMTAAGTAAFISGMEMPCKVPET